MATTPYKQRRLKAIKEAYRGRGFKVRDLWPEDDPEPRTCGICRSEISARDKASIDHIVPLIEGGREEWGNVQLAHITCNRRKGWRDRPHDGLAARPVLTSQCMGELCRICPGSVETETGATVRCACGCHRSTAWARW